MHACSRCKVGTGGGFGEAWRRPGRAGSRILPLTMPCTYDSLTPIGPSLLISGSFRRSKWTLQNALNLAYDVRCALGACMFKMEALDM